MAEQDTMSDNEQKAKSAEDINEDILLDMQMELRAYLFIRPSNLNVIEDKAVALCDGVVKMFEDKDFVIANLQSQNEKLVKENQELREALNEITKTNWVNGKYFGRSSAQLHLVATKIAEQALKK